MVVAIHASFGDDHVSFGSPRRPVTDRLPHRVLELGEVPHGGHAGTGVALLPSDDSPSDESELPPAAPPPPKVARSCSNDIPPESLTTRASATPASSSSSLSVKALSICSAMSAGSSRASPASLRLTTGHLRGGTPQSRAGGLGADARRCARTGPPGRARRRSDRRRRPRRRVREPHRRVEGRRRRGRGRCSPPSPVVEGDRAATQWKILAVAPGRRRLVSRFSQPAAGDWEDSGANNETGCATIKRRAKRLAIHRTHHTMSQVLALNKVVAAPKGARRTIRRAKVVAR